MAQRVTDTEMIKQAKVAMFRFQATQLNEWLDGSIWILQEGDDYPHNLTFRSLRSRLRSAAESRNGRVKVIRIARDAVQIQFWVPEKVADEAPADS